MPNVDEEGDQDITANADQRRRGSQIKVSVGPMSFCFIGPLVDVFYEVKHLLHFIE